MIIYILLNLVWILAADTFVKLTGNIIEILYFTSEKAEHFMILNFYLITFSAANN
jgi:hypothetical protein